MPAGKFFDSVEKAEKWKRDKTMEFKRSKTMKNWHADYWQAELE
jgi:hypothetical protein